MEGAKKGKQDKVGRPAKRTRKAGGVEQPIAERKTSGREEREGKEIRHEKVWEKTRKGGPRKREGRRQARINGPREKKKE